MSLIKSAIQIISWLSLDVVAGGMVFTCAVAKIAGVELHWSVPTALGCCIWLIYTLDHLIDGNRAANSPSMSRHLFHRKYRTPIFIAFLLIAGVGLKLLFFLPYNVLIYGCMLLGLVGLYFLSIWFFKIYFAKELFIAVLYACGVFLGTFSLGNEIDLALLLLFLQTILMASINLLLFSYYELNQDRNDGHKSWATHFGEIKTYNHIKGTFFLLIILILFTSLSNLSIIQLNMQIIFVVMSAVLALVYLLPSWANKGERFRWLGDVIFLLPGIIFLL